VNSVEWPHAILGEFDPRFLALPREILIAVMRGHQKYFAVEDSTGKLEPRFVTILNREDDPKGLIRAGHERVLRARFTDAEFFWDTDQKAPLRDRMPLLERVTYHEKLGSYAAKVRRVEQIAKAIADLWVNQGLISEDKIELISAAVRLSKCDLTTQMVQEFPELQGVVGGLYAQAQAEPQEVADAVYDHYRPAGLQDEGPRSPIGRAASLADKIDAVSSGFAVGLAPSGSSDPFGLRKQASGVIKALLASEISLDLKPLIRAAINGLNKPDLSSETSKLLSVMSGVADFFRERVAYYLDSVDGIRYDTIRAAVLASGEPNVWNVFGDDPLNIRERAVQCERNRNDARFLSLCAAAKRIRNILTKSAAGSEALGDAFKMELFEKDEERLLANALTDVVPQAKDLARKREFGRALLTISELSQPVDRFFDSVMVMVEDVKVRENRLRMLNYLNGVCGAIVDFSQIVAEEASVSAAPKAKGSTALERDAEH